MRELGLAEPAAREAMRATALPAGVAAAAAARFLRLSADALGAPGEVIAGRHRRVWGVGAPGWSRIGRPRVRQNIFAYQLCKRRHQLFARGWFLVPPHPGEFGQ